MSYVYAHFYDTYKGGAKERAFVTESPIEMSLSESFLPTANLTQFPLNDAIQDKHKEKLRETSIFHE